MSLRIKSRKELLNIRCADSESAITVTSTSILTIEPSCVVANSEILLLPQHSASSTKIQKIKISYLNDSLLDYGIKTNFSLPHIREMHLNPEQIIEQAATLQNSIQRYEDEILTSRQKNFAYHSFNTLQIASYLALGLVILFSLYKCGAFNPFELSDQQSAKFYVTRPSIETSRNHHLRCPAYGTLHRSNRSR